MWEVGQRAVQQPAAPSQATLTGAGGRVGLLSSAVTSACWPGPAAADTHQLGLSGSHAHPR